MGSDPNQTFKHINMIVEAQRWNSLRVHNSQKLIQTQCKAFYAFFSQLIYIV